MDAASEAEVIARLQRHGAMPMRAEPADRRRLVRRCCRCDSRPAWPAQQEVADLIRELATMLGAGQDLDRALRYMQETAPARGPADGDRRCATRCATAARCRWRWRAIRAAFPAMHIGLVRAGEAGGNLAPTLARMADLLDRQRSLAATVNSALIYPALLLLARSARSRCC